MGLMADIDGYERRLKSLEQELEKEKQFTNEFACKVIVLSAEIERVSGDGGNGGSSGKVKSKEFQDLFESYTKLQSKVQSKNSEIDTLITRITALENRSFFDNLG